MDPCTKCGKADFNSNSGRTLHIKGCKGDLIASAPVITQTVSDGEKKEVRMMFSTLPVLVLQRLDSARSQIIARFRTAADAKKFISVSGYENLEIDETIR